MEGSMGSLMRRERRKKGEEEGGMLGAGVVLVLIKFVFLF